MVIFLFRCVLCEGNGGEGGGAGGGDGGVSLSIYS
jgi:hypothetical protein